MARSSGAASGLLLLQLRRSSPATQAAGSMIGSSSLRLRVVLASLSQVRSHANVNPAVSMWAEKRANRDSFAEWEDLRDRRVREGSQHAAGRLGRPDPEQVDATKQMRQLARERRWEEALEIYARFPYPDHQLSTTAMDACAKSLQLEPAKRVFEAMPMKSTPSYNVMINLLGRLKRVHEAEPLLQRMVEDTCEPNSITMTGLITGHGMVYDSNAAVRVLEEMEEGPKQLPTGPVTYGAAMAACARAGDLPRCEQLLQRMDQKRIEVGSAHLVSLVNSCAREKLEDRARQAFQEIRNRGFKPDIFAYTCLLNCLHGEEAMVKADALFAEMQAEGMRPDTFVFNALLGVAISANDSQRFGTLLEEMARRGLQPTGETRLRRSEMANREERLAREQARAAYAARDAQQHVSAQQQQQQQAPLPAGWHEHMDPTSGRTYYWMASNPAGTTTWERPS